MCRKLVVLTFVLAFCLASSATAANIIYVSDAYDERVDSIPDDQGWVDLLVAQGYNVDYTKGATLGNGYWRTLDAAKIARLNAADLVIVSRATDSGGYATDAAEIAQWNSVTTPLILLNVYIARGGTGSNFRWRWANSESLAADGGTPTLEALDPHHPIFKGVALDAKNRVDIYNQAVGTGTVSFFNYTNMGNGTRWVDVDADLTWLAGSTGIWHDIYFGTDQAAVANGTGGTFKVNQPTTTYHPGALATNTT